MKYLKLLFIGLNIIAYTVVGAQSITSGVEPLMNMQPNQLATIKTVGGHGLGQKPMQQQYIFSKRPPMKAAYNLPKSYDLRIVEGGKYLSAVKDQGSEGACWAFATYGAIESYWLKLGKGQFDFSEQNLVTCNGFDHSTGFGGNASMSIAYLSRLNGAISESDDPYSLPENPECIGELTPSGYITEVRFLPGKDISGYDPGKNRNHSNLDQLTQLIDGEDYFNSDLIKQSLIENGGLYIDLRWDDNFFNEADNTYFYNGQFFTDHAVLLVGWDDNKEVTGGIVKPKTKGAWICRNSWGEEWGENGYFYISYEDTKALSEVAYFPSAIDYDANKKVFQYDDLGYEDSYGFENETAYGLVRFDTEKPVVITQIGLSIIMEGESAEIEVYDNFDGSHLSGLLGSANCNSITYPGYYNFSLNNKVSIPANDDFYVKVKFTTPGFNKPIAIENNSFASIERGKYWISNSGNDSWTAIGLGTQKEFDLCIKAYGMFEPSSPDLSKFQNNSLQYNEIADVDPVLSDIQMNSFKVFPNPASRFITITGLKTNSSAEISILNISGIEVYHTICSNGHVLVPIQHLSEGLYLINITCNNNHKTMPFIIKNQG